MAAWHKKLLIPLSVLALLSACDDKEQTSASGWGDFFNDSGKPMAIAYGVPSDFVQETQAGNYLAGQFAQYRQDFATANKYMDKAMAYDPSNVQLQNRAMILSMQAGDTNRAISLARKVLAEDNKNMLALLFVAVDQMARQEYGPAAKSMSHMPQNGIADFIKPILIAWTKAPDAGAVDDDDLINISPLHAYHALLIADYKGEVKNPEKYLINILASGGVDSHILEMTADVLSRQGKQDMAKKIYETLLTQYQQDGTASTHIEILENKRDHAKDVKTGRIGTPEQGSSEAFYNLARVLYQDQSDDSALVFARIAQHLDPASENSKILMAKMMIRSDHINEAIAFYKSVSPGSEDYLESQRSAAELMEQEGQVDDAVAFLEKLYKDSKDIGALIQIGDTYRRAEKHDQAIKAYNRAADALGGEIGPDYWNLLYARGMSYERYGDMVNSEKDLEKAMSFKPDHPYLLNYLGYSWADQGKKLDKAMELVTKAATLRPDDGYIIDSLGWIYYKTGQYKQAADELEKAVELVPYDPTINDHLGDAYWQVGRKQEARFQWQRALNHSKEDTLSATLKDKIENGLKEKKITVQQAKKDIPAPTSVKQ